MNRLEVVVGILALRSRSGGCVEATPEVAGMPAVSTIGLADLSRNVWRVASQLSLPGRRRESACVERSRSKAIRAGQLVRRLAADEPSRQGPKRAVRHLSLKKPSRTQHSVCGTVEQ